MNGLLLQDSGRPGKTRWATETIARGDAAGIVVSPFFTPSSAAPRRPSAQQVIAEVIGAGGQALYDPMTHAALLPQTNLWETYTSWDLWDGARGDLSTPGLRAGHVLRVVDAQVVLGLPPLAPTVRLDSSVEPNAETSLELAALTRSQGSGIWLPIVGSGAFWAQGRLLDDYVGQIAQLRPAGVSLSVIRTAILYPPDAIAAEIAGLCRSVHSLSLRCEVIVQHADLFGFPALAAGARGIGTGWDLRQRVLAPDGFRHDTSIRRTAKRITHAGLYGVLKRPEAERLARLERALSSRLVPGALPPDGNALWEHHLSVLAPRAASIIAMLDRRARSNWLASEYANALNDFRQVEARARPLQFGPASWLEAVSSGLAEYMVGEGW